MQRDVRLGLRGWATALIVAASLTPAMAPAAAPEAPAVAELVQQLKPCKDLTCKPFVALVARGADVWPAIAVGLDAPEEMVRFWTVGVISELKLVAARERLIALLKRDPLERIRGVAAFALGAQRDRALTPVLVGALSDRDVNVRFEAASALYHTRDPAAVSGLLRVLRDRDEDVRRAAAEALGVIGDARAVKPLLRRLARDRVAVVRGFAAIALSQLSAASAVEPLIGRLTAEQDADALSSAAFALGVLGDQRAVEPLSALSKHPSEKVRKHAADALEALRKPETPPKPATPDSATDTAPPSR